MKFKVGDRVLCKENYITDNAKGRIGKVFVVRADWSIGVKFEKPVSLCGEEMRKIFFDGRFLENLSNDKVQIQEVLYGTKTTIIKWSDGTQTEAVCSPEDNFDKQVGFAIAYTRKMNGGKLSE